MKQKKERNGFTLVELMVSAALTFFLIATIMSILTLGRTVWQDADTKLINVQEGRRALAAITFDLMNSSWASPAGANCGAGITITDIGSFDTVCFHTLSIDPDTGVASWAAGEEIRYEPGDNNQLIRTNLTTGETRVLANYVSEFHMTPLGTDPQVLTATLLLGKRSLSTRWFSNSLQTNISVRN